MPRCHPYSYKGVTGLGVGMPTVFLEVLEAAGDASGEGAVASCMRPRPAFVPTRRQSESTMVVVFMVFWFLPAGGERSPSIRPAVGLRTSTSLASRLDSIPSALDYGPDDVASFPSCCPIGQR